MQHLLLWHVGDVHADVSPMWACTCMLGYFLEEKREGHNTSSPSMTQSVLLDSPFGASRSGESTPDYAGHCQLFLLIASNLSNPSNPWRLQRLQHKAWNGTCQGQQLIQERILPDRWPTCASRESVTNAGAKNKKRHYIILYIYIIIYTRNATCQYIVVV